MASVVADRADPPTELEFSWLLSLPLFLSFSSEICCLFVCTFSLCATNQSVNWAFRGSDSMAVCECGKSSFSAVSSNFILKVGILIAVGIHFVHGCV